MDCLDFFGLKKKEKNNIFLFLDVIKLCEIFGFNFFIFLVFGFLSKLLRLLLKVFKVATEHQKLPKIGQNSIISFLLFPRRAKKSLGVFTTSTNILQGLIRYYRNNYHSYLFFPFGLIITLILTDWLCYWPVVGFPI